MTPACSNNTAKPRNKLSDPKYLVVLSVYVAIQALVYLFSDTMSHYAPDTGGYLSVTMQIPEGAPLDFGLRLPVYPAFLAVTILPFKNAIFVPVLLQAVLLWVAAHAIAALGREILRTPFIPVLALVALNPHTISLSQLLLPDTLFASIFSIFLFSAYHFFGKVNPGGAVFLGLLLGLATLTRANGLALFAGWFFIAATHFHLTQKAGSVKLYSLYFLLLLVGMALIAPWVHHNYDALHDASIVSPEYRAYAINDNLAAAHILKAPLSYDKETSFEQARIHIRSIAIEHSEELLTPSGRANDHHQNRLSEQYKYEIIQRFSAADIVVAMTAASARFFLDPGHGEISAIFPCKIGRGVAIVSWLLSFVVIALFISGACFLARQKNTQAIVYFLVPVVLVWLSSAFIGYARYRLPVEPMILCVAVNGILPILKGSGRHP